MRLYLAGPMTGKPRWNFDAFEKAAAELRAAGFEVVSPAEADLEAGFDPDAPVADFTLGDLRAALARDVQLVLESDGVALLPGWIDSKGAWAEYALAAAARIPSTSVEGWIKRAQEGRL